MIGFSFAVLVIRKLKKMVCNLHVHSQHSRLDGLMPIDQILNRAEELGQKAIAITDHGELSGAIPLLLTSRGRSIKPIIGYEAYMVEDRFKKKMQGKKREKKFHLILLAKNLMGYRNLVKLSSEAYITGFYDRPRIDWALLEEHNEGLLAMTACLGGMIPQSIMGEISDTAQSLIKRYLDIFEGRFYLEMIPFQDEKQKPVNLALVKFAKELNLPFTVTADSHYCYQEDFVLHNFLLAIQTNARWDDPKRFQFHFPDFYIRDDASFHADLSYLHKKVRDKALQETEAIADQIDDLREDAISIPPIRFDVPDDKEYFRWKVGRQSEIERTSINDQEAYFRYLLGLGFRKKIPENDPNWNTYRDRMNYEFGIIKERNFIDYFLVVHDYINWARQNGILVGPGRGSAAGSLVAYLLDITEVDPIKHNLIFERFISPGRTSLPDIDTDFQHDRRDEVKNYLSEKYGGNVRPIATYIAMQKRTTIKDAARVLGKTPQAAEKISDMIMKEIAGAEDFTFKDIFTDHEFYQTLEGKMTAYFKDQAPFFLKMISGLEGTIKSWGEHAAGVILSSEDLENVIPLRMLNENVVTANDMYDLEDFGLLKLDILGIKTLTTISETIDNLIKTYGAVDISFDWDNLEADQETWDMICEGHCIGMFQLETPALTHLVRQQKPRNMKDLTDAMALVRPGPLRSGLTNVYIKRRDHLEAIFYPFPILDEVLDDTEGIMLYQEQVIKIAEKLADYSPEEADNLRRIIGKKKQKEMDAEQEKFVSRMKKKFGKNKESENEILKLWNNVVEFGGYSFNKAHAASYAVLAFRTAYLKTHYPEEFMTALLNNESANQSLFLDECRRMGIRIKLPSISRSGKGFTLDDHEIRFGLMAIKNVGPVAVEEIISKQPYESGRDFLERISSKVNKQVVESLIAAGALDEFFPGATRKQILNGYYKYRGINQEAPEIYSDNTKMEIEYLGIPISENPFDKYKGILKKNCQIADSGMWLSFPDGRDVMISGTIHGSKKFVGDKGTRYDFTLSSYWGEHIRISSFHDTDITVLENKAVAAKVQKRNGFVNLMQIWDIEYELEKE